MALAGSRRASGNRHIVSSFQWLNKYTAILDLAEPTQYGPRGFGGGGSAAILLKALLGSDTRVGYIERMMLRSIV
jgi:hypothetical protein